MNETATDQTKLTKYDTLKYIEEVVIPYIEKSIKVEFITPSFYYEQYIIPPIMPVTFNLVKREVLNDLRYQVKKLRKELEDVREVNNVLD